MCNKLVSVIIPTYNRADNILKSINSVLNQTIKDIEIIIVDDGSNDETYAVVKSIKDDRIRYIKHIRNMGVSAARNTGIKYTKGEYIAFQDSDEVWYKNSANMSSAVWIGNGISNQFTIKVTTNARLLRTELHPGFGYNIRKGRATVTKFISEE